MTLDRLSGGRLVLGVGTGAGPFEWDYCGEEADPVIRGDMLDEHLDLLSRLWTGDPSRYEGRYYTVAGPTVRQVLPPPLQQPRIPIWVGGTWPGTRPFTRAARWDGVVPMRSDGTWAVADTAAVAQRMRSLRGDAGPRSTSPSRARATPPTRSHGTVRRACGRRGDLVDRGGPPVALRLRGRWHLATRRHAGTHPCGAMS